MFRLGNEAPVISRVNTLMKGRLEGEAIVSLVEALAQVGYLMADHLVWLSSHGIARSFRSLPEHLIAVIRQTQLPRYRKLANLLWLLWLVLGAASNTLRLLAGLAREQRIRHDSSKDSKQLDLLRAQRRAQTLAYVRLGGDAIVAAAGAELIRVSDGVIGLAGLVAALAAIVATWP